MDLRQRTSVFAACSRLTRIHGVHVNGFAESLKAASPAELLEGFDPDAVKAEGQAILRSAVKIVEERKKMREEKRLIEEDRYANKPRQ